MNEQELDIIDIGCDKSDLLFAEIIDNAKEKKGEKYFKFQKSLEDLINLHSIENECDMPDFLLAEMIVKFIKAVSMPIKKTLDWHGCNSICHPKRD